MMLPVFDDRRVLGLMLRDPSGQLGFDRSWMQPVAFLVLELR
jgi:hypothetical protein